jgi:hypothetical protein
MFYGTERHQARRLQAAAPGRGEDLLDTHAALAEGRAERPGLRPASRIHVALGRAIVDLEAGRVAAGAGRRVAMADQRDMTASDQGGPGSRESSAAATGAAISEIASATSASRLMRRGYSAP